MEFSIAFILCSIWTSECVAEGLVFSFPRILDYDVADLVNESHAIGL